MSTINPSQAAFEMSVPRWMTDVLATLTAPSDENSWDLVVLVQYPSFAAFMSMAKNVDQEGPMHRRAALADSRTVLIKSPSFIEPSR